MRLADRVTPNTFKATSICLVLYSKIWTGISSLDYGSTFFPISLTNSKSQFVLFWVPNFQKVRKFELHESVQIFSINQEDKNLFLLTKVNFSCNFMILFFNPSRFSDEFKKKGENCNEWMNFESLL